MTEKSSSQSQCDGHINHKPSEPVDNIITLPQRRLRCSCNRWLLVAIAATTLGSSLPVGHCMGVLNTPQQVVREWVRESVSREYGVSISQNQDLALWALIVSLYIAGCAIGSMLGAPLANKAGRRSALLYAHLLCLLSSGLFMLCKVAYVIELLLLGRLLAGLAGGISSVVVPLYLSELASPLRRGVMGAVFPVGLTLGILIAQTLGTSSLMGKAKVWPLLVGGYIVYVLIALTLHPFIPESPTYYALFRQDFTAAKKELCRLRSEDNIIVDMEFRNLVATHEETKCVWSLTKLFTIRQLRRPLICIILLNAGQQLVGINAIFYYSTLVFTSAGLNLFASQLASLAATIINVVMAVTALPLLRFCRRKVLLLVSLVIWITSQITLMLCLSYATSAPILSGLSIAALLISVFGYGIGLGPVPYMLGTEILPAGPRGLGLSMGSFSNYFCNMIVGLLFPSVQTIAQELSFCLFIIISIMMAIFVVVYVPETFDRNGILLKQCELNINSGNEQNNTDEDILCVKQHTQPMLQDMSNGLSIKVPANQC